MITNKFYGRPKRLLGAFLIVSFLLSAAGAAAAQTKKRTGEKIVPVILIHGIGGSNLRQPRESDLPNGKDTPANRGLRRPGGFPHEVAKNIFLINGKPENIAFDASGKPRADTLSITAIADGFYDIPGKNITHLSSYLKKQFKQSEDKDNPVFDFAYDFRFSVLDNADKLGAAIERLKIETSAAQVDIVGHSLGGLIAKAYLTSDENAANVRNLIFVGTPHLGSPKALKALRYGDDLDVAVIDKCKLKRAARNYPAMYNLLPGRRYFEAQTARTGGAAGYFYDDDDLDGDAARGLLDYAQTLNNLKNGKESAGLCPLDAKSDVMKGDESVPLDRLNEPLIERETIEFHARLDNWKKPPGVRVYNIVGYGRETVSAIRQSGGKVTVDLTTEGDGTVPLWSAEAVESDFIYYVNLGKLNLEHSIMIGDKNFGVQIYELMTRGKSAAIPQAVAARPATARFVAKTRDIETVDAPPDAAQPKRAPTRRKKP